MNQKVVELFGTIRVTVPIAYRDELPDEDELTAIARQAYETTVNNGPAQIYTESLELGSVKGVWRHQDPVALLGSVLTEYQRIKPSLDWYTNNGYEVTDSEVLLWAIDNVLRRMGYALTLIDNEEPISSTADSRDAAF